MTEAVHVAAAITGGAALVHGVQMRKHARQARRCERERAPDRHASRPCRRAARRSPSAAEQLRVLDALRRCARRRLRRARSAGAGLAPADARRASRSSRSTSASSATRPAATATSTPGPTRTEEMTRDDGRARAARAGRDRRSRPSTSPAARPSSSRDFRDLVERRARARPARDRPLQPDDPARCRATRTCREFLARARGRGRAPRCRTTGRLSTDRQRGDGVFERSIEALRRLNAVGYGARRAACALVLVTNPVGAFLPARRRRRSKPSGSASCARLHGVEFDALFTITNMPIAATSSGCETSGNLAGYLAAARRRLQPGRGGGRHVPHDALGRLGRAPLRLRLQPDARPRDRRRRAAPPARLRPRGARRRAAS